MRPEQESAAQHLAERLSLDVVAAGIPGAASVRRARLLGQESVDDFRRTIAEHPDAMLIMLALDDDEREALCAPNALPRGMAESRAPIISAEPIAPTLTVVRELSEDHAPWLTRFRRVPSMLLSPAGAAAMASLESFGRIRSIDLAARTGANEVSLAALLLDAMELIAATLGEPETIDASLSGPDAPSGLRLTPGDSLPLIAGDLTAHLRFADDRAAAVSLSDRAGSWFRGATLLGHGGCIRFDDLSFEWNDQSGAMLDESRAEAPEGPLHQWLLVEQVRAIIEDRAERTPPPRLIEAYALAEAALLSARTGQPESPATIRRMAGVA